MTGLARRSHYGLRPDWRQLSSGVGVPPGPGITLPFPPSKVRATVSESLPPAAKQDSHILDFDEVFNRWETSSGAAHGPKTHRDVYAQPNYPLSSRIKKTLGVKDFGEKLQLRPCRHPLTMAYQESETKGKYKGWPNLGPETIRRAGPQPWELECYHAQGPSQASSKNQAFFGLPFRVPGQYYLTTTARDFRYYTRRTLSSDPDSSRGLSRKELASHTRNSRPHQNLGEQPRLQVLETLKPRPLAARLDQANQHIPHRGALSLTKESYGIPRPSLRRTDQFCPLEAPCVGPQVQPVPSLQTMPHVYRTENSRYGSLKPAFV